MITNADVFHALKTLQVFCADHEGCAGCPLNLGTDVDCAFSVMRENSWCDLPAHWNVESLRPLLDPASTTLDH